MHFNVCARYVSAIATVLAFSNEFDRWCIYGLQSCCWIRFSISLALCLCCRFPIYYHLFPVTITNTPVWNWKQPITRTLALANINLHIKFVHPFQRYILILNIIRIKKQLTLKHTFSEWLFIDKLWVWRYVQPKYQILFACKWNYRPYSKLLVVSISFYRAMLCICGTSHGPVSVRLSVCLSQVGVLLKRLNVRSHKQHHTIAHGL